MDIERKSPCCDAEIHRHLRVPYCDACGKDWPQRDLETEWSRQDNLDQLRSERDLAIKQRDACASAMELLACHVEWEDDDDGTYRGAKDALRAARELMGEE